MKKLKTVPIVILSIIVISILVYFLPMDGLTSKIPFLNRFYTNTALEVVAIKGKATMEINGEEYGETPITINELVPGDYTIQLKRISQTDDFYKPQTLNVKLTKNTTSRIEIEIGPAGILHGAILYYSPQNNLDDNQGSLSILSEVENSKIYLDGEYIKKTPVIAHTLTAKEYELEIGADGYETLTIPILIEQGYLLNVKTYLFPIPINFDTVTNG